MTTASTVKEHPILFRPEMVRAILDGRKTQTRRVVKSTRPIGACHRETRGVPGTESFEASFAFWTERGVEKFFLPCPYGQPGDRLWVKETWLTSKACDGRSPSSLRGHGWPLWYVADGAVFWTGARDGGPDFVTPGKTRVSIHMPRWASRITLEITGVRIERLKEITEADAAAEGADGPKPMLEGGEIVEIGPTCHRHGFQDLWEQLHGKDSWAANPWVWVISFKRIGD